MDYSEAVTQARAAYVAPKLSLIGSLERLTQSTGTGGHLDAAYASGTPASDIFS